ncbi:SusC/RagA family TonB-linked outer membrane protein [Niastella vici]|uniref:SusC/RagA family TonB-linked outer membrane protein n=1 Tax=Niastella vici TaxID=1703345 RepID=A0A1V9FX51_9BACT|nr:SusC/RagA family TonB-linked outer membrane protein [Niastella vici]OQP62816.1 SusC/RagA family TonB-linked outer membrane protein [Niastella vici]
MRKFLPLLAVLLGCTLLAAAQTKEISGRIVDKAGAPIPNASVIIKGTNKATVADFDGNFSIKTSPGTSLTITAVGYKTVSIKTQNQTALTIALESADKLMDEVIVTAGGIKAKRKELGSVNTVIKSDALTAGKAVDIANGLQGKVAGFMISGTGGGVNPSYRLILRGQRSLTGNNQALVVLDNVVVPNTFLSGLNPEDIDEVTVLNGAGAAALYGSMASNGALIITTKKGKKGTTSVAVSNTLTVESVGFYPKIQKKFGAGGSAYGLDANGKPLFNYLENQSYGPAFDGVKRPLGAPLEGGGQDSAVYAYNAGHFKFWEKGITNQTDLSLQTGDDRSTFYLSGQYVKATGTTPGDKMNRTTVRINGTRKVGEKVNVTYSSSYSQKRLDITTQTGSMYANMLNMPSNVDITKYKNWRTDSFANPNGYYNPWYANPYFTADNNRANYRDDYLTASVELKFTPVKGLDLIARQGISTHNYSGKNTVGAFTYTDYAKHTDQSSKSDISASVNDYGSYNTNLITDLFLQYNKTVSDFSFNLTSGAQFTQNQAKYVAVSANGLVIPNLFNVSNGVGTPGASEGNFKARQVGVYGDLRIGYKNYLFLHATSRNDWVSILNPENRSFFYPSAEVSFIASEVIDALKQTPISYLKLRANWSKVGQVNLGTSSDFGAYYLNPIYSPTNGFPYGSLAGYSVGNGLVSKNLTPEFTKGYEFGFDLNAWQDRITTNFTYFDTKTTNQTVTTNISNATGFTGLLTNAGQTETKGVEATASVVAFQNKDWLVNVGGNYTYEDNSVIYITTDLPKLSLASSGSGSSYAVAGRTFPVIMGYDYVRDPQGHVIVDRTTGLPTKTADIVVLGNATPRHRLGLNGSVEYKGIRLSFVLEHRGDYKIFNSMGPEMDWSGTGYRTAVYNRESFVYPNSVYEDPSKPGTYIKNTSVAIANGNGNNGFWTDGINRDVTSNYVTSAAFWKLREVTLSYTLPASVLGKVSFIKQATFSIQGRNLLMWMAKDNLYTDPEYSTSGNENNGVGLTGLNSAPPSRFYGASISLKF